MSESYQPLPAVSADRVKNSCIRILCMAVLSAGVLPLGWKFCVAPPLLVAFTEMSEKSVKPGRSAKIAILITLCAAEGALCRLLIAEKADPASRRRSLCGSSAVSACYEDDETVDAAGRSDGDTSHADRGRSDSMVSCAGLWRKCSINPCRVCFL